MTQSPLQVRHFMTRDLVTITPDTEVARAVSIMIERDISGLLVTDGAGGVAGVLTERDCIGAAAESGYYGEWGGPVSGFMSTPVETVSPDDNLVDVAAHLASSRFRRFPVVEQGRLVGLLSRRDVLRAVQAGSWWSMDPSGRSGPGKND